MRLLFHIHTLSITLLQRCLPVASCPMPHKRKKNEWHCFGHKHRLFVQNVSFIYNAVTRLVWLCHQAWSGVHETHQNWAHLPLSRKAISVWVKMGKKRHDTADSSPSLAGCRRHIHSGRPAQGLQLRPAFRDGFSFPTAQRGGTAAGFCFGKKIGARTNRSGTYFKIALLPGDLKLER